jgi:hypothetical protein
MHHESTYNEANQSQTTKDSFIHHQEQSHTRDNNKNYHKQQVQSGVHYQ